VVTVSIPPPLAQQTEKRRTMNSYELRVINPAQKYPTIYASSHISDFAAVRRAVSLAHVDELIEVWRGVVCVYSGTPIDALAL